MKKVYLLEDCTSPVVVPGVVDYTEQADAAFRHFAGRRHARRALHRPDRKLGVIPVRRKECRLSRMTPPSTR